jgi:Protein of unknown function (DUF3054)
MPSRNIQVTFLALGDITTLALITGFGFATHGELGSAGLRLLTTFIPLLIAWFAVAPFLGAYDLQRAVTPSQLWRPFWAMILAAPLAAWLRGAWLHAPILPIFVLVLGGFSSLGILAWRVVYFLIFSKRLAAPRAPNG